MPSFSATFSAPFYTGGASTLDVPGLWPVALAGRPYMIDTADQNWKDTSIPMLKNLYDPNPTPSEASLNAEGLWRRAQDSWHEGAGQVYRDRDASGSAYRYRSSKGIDPWTRYQMSLLNDTGAKLTSANTNLALVVAGARLYVADGSTLRYTADLTTWTAVTGYTGGAISGLTSDGFTVYISDGANIWTTTTAGTTAATSADTKDATMLAYVKGRLMAAVGNILYNIPTLGSAASMTFTHPNANFTWVGCTEGIGQIYAAGYAGDKSVIYRTSILADGTALGIPIVAASLPDGEIVRSIQGYLGKVMIGTDDGIRVAEEDTNGNLVLGGLVSIPTAVRCFEPQDRFCWFGWTNYDATSTGLGRLDLMVDGDPVTVAPAYASDLMATGQGAVLSVATFLDVRVFAISGLGVYGELTTKVTSATLDSGLFSYGLADSKTLMFVNAHNAPLPAGSTLGMSAAGNGGAFSSLGTISTVNTSDTEFNANQATAEQFEVRVTLTRATDTTTGPTLRRYTLKALAGSHDGPNEYINLPILLAREIELQSGQKQSMDVAAEISALKGLRRARSVVALQYIDQLFSVVVEDYEITYMKLPADAMSGRYSQPEGTIVLKLKRIS